MGKRKKRSINIEQIQTDRKLSKQLTLDCLAPGLQRKPRETKDLLPSASVEASSMQNNQIIITRLGSLLEEDELTLEVEFKLLPSRIAFSKIRADLWFDEQKIDSVSIAVPQKFGLTNEFQWNPVIDLKGISSGPHIAKVEMYEAGPSGEKRACSIKEVAIKYVPQSKETRHKKAPTVKKIEGFEIAVVSSSEKGIYREIEEAKRKELISNRDEW
jgi:hypothetical protein